MVYNLHIFDEYHIVHIRRNLNQKEMLKRRL